MNNDLISRSALITAINTNSPTFHDGQDIANWQAKCINEAPAVDAEPVQHGEWILNPCNLYNNATWVCSVCGRYNKFPVVAWGKTAELCVRFLSKGRKVAIDGRLQTRSYDAQDGGKRYVTEVVAEQVEFLSSAQRESGGSAGAEAPADGFTDYGGELPF